MRNRDKERIKKGRERGESFNIETQTYFFLFSLKLGQLTVNSLPFISFQLESSCLKKDQLTMPCL